MDLTRQDEKAPILRALPSRLLGQTAALVSKVAADALEATGSHRHEFAVLATLDAFGDCSQAELCRRTDLDRSDMNAIVTSLEGRRQITRTVDVHNRRQNVVALTDSGQQVFKRLRSVLAKAQDHALSPLAPSDRAELMRILGLIHDHLAPAAE